MGCEEVEMAERYGVYRCNVCGNVVRVNLAGKGELVCCGQPMELLRPQAEEQGGEKHLPLVERTPQGIRVRVGSVAHPMEQAHHISWVEVDADGCRCERFLEPGDEPVVEFLLRPEWQPRAVRAYCNVHGLWERRI